MKFLWYVMCVLGCISTSQLWSQETPSRYYDKAGEYYEFQKYDSAILFVDFAIEGYEIAKVYDTLVDAIASKAQYVLMGEGPDASLEFLDQNRSRISRYFPELTHKWIDIYYQYVNASEVKGEYQTGMEYVEKMFETIESSSVPMRKQARSYSMAARIYHSARKHREGINYAKKANDLFLKADPDTSNSYYANLNTLAAIYQFNSQYDSSIYYSTYYLEGVKKIYGEKHFNVGVGYNSIASTHYNLGRYPNALEYYSQAEDVFQEYYEKTGQNIYVNIIRTNIALVYLDLNEYNLAEEYALSVWPSDLENYGATSPKLLYTLGRLVSIYHGMEDLASAEIYVNYIQGIFDSNPGMTASNKCYALNYLLSQAVRTNQLSKAIDVYDKYHYWYGQSGEDINKTFIATFSELGIAYSKAGKRDSSIIYHRKALDEYKKIFPVQNNAVFKEYLLIAENLADSNPLVASNVLDTAIALRISPTPFNTFQEAIAHCDPSPLTLSVIKLKLSILAGNEKLFAESRKQITTIIENYDEYIQSYFMIIRSQSRLNDLAEENDIVYGYAVENFLREGDVERAFIYAEKNRSLSIRIALNQYESLEYANIPQDIIEKESRYLSDINQYRIKKNLFATSDSARSETRKAYQDELNEYLSWLADLKNEYPEYYNIKYDLSFPEIASIKRKIPANSCILSYKYFMDTLYAFILTKKDLSVHKMKLENVKGDLEMMRKNINNGRYSDSLSLEVYRKLWEPIEDKILKNVFIIPDKYLHYLSFEMLKDFNGDFIIENYNISYGIAADLLFSDRDMTNREQKWVAFAPGFQDSLKEKYTRKVEGKIDSVYLQYLQQPWTLDFASKLQKTGEALVFMGSDATEKNFIQQTNTSPLIFIGTHAEIDDSKPNYSKLVFAKPLLVKQHEDGYLHTYEIYGRPLNAELAILTACNTGVGRIRDGEGILSLSHSFSYAGCPSIVMTKWSVDEATSMEIIDYFWNELKKGESKNVALRNAKLAFIKENPEFGRNPYYFAGLTLIGDPSPVYSSGINIWFFLIGVGIFLLLIVLLVWRRRKKE